MGTTEELSTWLVNTAYKDIPNEAVRIAKEQILACIGEMVGGSREPVSQGVIRYVKDSGGVAECGVLGGGFRTSLSNALFVNGTSTHAQEMEAVGMHSGSNPMTTIPVALGIAEKYGLTGKAVLEAMILGFEIQSKLGMGCPGAYDCGFASISFWGTLGATATAAKALKLNVDQTRIAFGIGTSQASGYQRHTATNTHALEAGLACRNGITAAILAREGVTADRELIEGKKGFIEINCSGGKGYDREFVTRSLGNPFYIISPGLYIKKYGCNMWHHHALDSLLDLMKEHDIHYHDVDSVQANVPMFVTSSSRFSDPKNYEETKFSLEHCLAAALFDRKTDLGIYSNMRATDPMYKEARKKIKVVGVPGTRSEGCLATVNIKMKDGRSYSRTADINKVKGGPANPLSKEELVARYEIAVRGLLSSRQVQRSVDLVFDLDNLDKVSELMELATFGYLN